MADDEARERARRRLEERQARMRGEAPVGRDAHESHEPISSGRLRSSRSGTGNRHSWEARGPEPLFALSEAATNLVRAVGLKRFAIAVAAIAIVVALVAGVRGCMAAGAAAPAPDEADQAPVQQQAQRDPIDEDELKAVLGDELAAQLVQAAETSDDVAWIAAHPDAYAGDGEAVQHKLLKLAAVEPEAVPFVRTFPDAYPAESALGTDDPASGEVPRLYQWDSRWGSTVYSSTAFALTGCCPTSLSMVYQGLTGKGDLSPYDMGKRASDGGYETAFDGTDATFLVNEAASLGLSCEALAADADSVRSALEGGAVLICNVGPGDFTDNGHFFVITGIDDEGNLAINDPYSAERSNRAWDVDTVLGQTIGLWAYRLA
ncbi:C39 family peptidase [Eggerthella guodeyinii]|uniref:C39 family peptidase n=1 Tax=Eggerthella guodeyinii TaxID=2690837 RepID=A0A6L7IQC1_9ACTN|nr:C39 family peptidase [Eggerthella guodeyinii]QOS69826.1 C39 family peptidase [Eggerthella guodeyinii]